MGADNELAPRPPTADVDNLRGCCHQWEYPLTRTAHVTVACTVGVGFDLVSRAFARGLHALKRATAIRPGRAKSCPACGHGSAHADGAGLGGAGGHVGKLQIAKLLYVPAEPTRGASPRKRLEPENGGTGRERHRDRFVLRIEARNVLPEGSWLRR